MKRMLFLVLGLIYAEGASAADLAPWPVAEKAAAIAGCRLSIATHAEQDFLKRHQLKELPPNFRENTAPAMEPFLATCDCIFDHFEKLWSFDYFTAHQDLVGAMLDELVAGECAVQQAPLEKPLEPEQ